MDDEVWFIGAGGDSQADAQPVDPVASQMAFATGAGQSLTPTTIIIGIIALLVVGRLLGDSDKLGLQPAHIHIGPYNLLYVTLTSIIGILLLKLVVNRFPVIPALTNVVNVI